MDTVTHLVAGALTPLAFKNAPKTKALALFGIICGELPDIDVIAGKGPEAILSIHRGITHALILQPLFALVMALLFHRLLKKGDEDGTWTFKKTWFVALLALCIHLFLDCMTTFGTQIFLPFSQMRVGLPAIYIIDFLLTVPLLTAWFIILRRGSSRAPNEQRLPLARSALAWLVCYPLASFALSLFVATHLEKTYATPGNRQGITHIELSPEPFAPLNWKAVGISPERYYMARFFLPSFNKELAFTPYDRPHPVTWQQWQKEVPLFSLYAQFTTYPAQTVHSEENGQTRYVFRDVRYEPTLPRLMDFVGRTDGLFLLEARTVSRKLSEYRFLYRGRDHATTPWEHNTTDEPQTNGSEKKSNAG